MRTDFIDRSSEKWGNLQPLYLDAIRAAEAQDDQFEGIPVASPEHLVAMKLAAGTDKDERDAIRLILCYSSRGREHRHADRSGATRGHREALGARMA